MLQKWRKRFRKQKAEASVTRRAGITLVETMVSVTLLMILLAMVVGIVSPAFRVFIRMQKLQFAQMILDNVVDDVQDTVREATGYVKIYAADGDGTVDIAGKEGDASGVVLEYINTDNFVTVLSTGGCADTYLYRGNKSTGTTFGKVDAGQLLYRYYRNVDTNSGSDATSDEYYYFATVDSDVLPIARAATTAFGSGYYMGNYLKITFSFPEGTSANDAVTHLNATASLYDDADMGDDDLVATENFVIDLRYDVKRVDGVTATTDNNNTMAFSK